MATTRRRLTQEQAERRAQVVELRRSRMTFDAIGHQLGISSQRAGRIFHDALAALPRHGVDEFRAEETEFIDHAVNSLMSIATDSTTSPRTRVEAWSAIMGWAERKARLLGLDSPAKHAVLTWTPWTRRSPR